MHPCLAVHGTHDVLITDIVHVCLLLLFCVYCMAGTVGGTLQTFSIVSIHLFCCGLAPLTAIQRTANSIISGSLCQLSNCKSLFVTHVQLCCFLHTHVATELTHKHCNTMVHTQY